MSSVDVEVLRSAIDWQQPEGPTNEALMRGYTVVATPSPALNSP